MGVVGGGLIAQIAHLPALRALDARFSVRALAEPSARVRAALARRYAIAETYASHEPMLERTELDAVIVCSPNGTHARVTLDALAAGLHVLVEKPLCLAPDDATAIERAARAAGRVVQVGYMKRFDPAYERLLASLPECGPLRLLASATIDPGIGERLRPAGFVAADDLPADAGATLRETTALQVAAAIGSEAPQHVRAYSDAFAGALIHDVNLLAGLLGDADDGWRVADAAGAGDDALAYGAWSGAGGARWSAAWLRVDAAASFEEELRVLGRDGVATLHFPAPYHGSAPAELRVAGEPALRWRPAADSYVRELEHFHACVAGGERCRTPIAQGARDVARLAELYRAAMAA